MDYTKLTSLEKDVLREVGNIGAGNAATSMSKLVNKKIEMKVPSVKVVTFDEMMDLIGGPDKTIVAMLFQIQGKIPGTVYFILSIQDAESLIENITGASDFSLQDNIEDNEMGFSALQEIGNIVTGSYLSALSDFTGLKMQPSVPHLSIDMAGAVLTFGLIEISQLSDYAIIINTKISDEEYNGIHGQFFLIPELDSLPQLFKALGIDTDE